MTDYQRDEALESASVVVVIVGLLACVLLVLGTLVFRALPSIIESLICLIM
jgi:hypothetical protein